LAALASTLGPELRILLSVIAPLSPVGAPKRGEITDIPAEALPELLVVGCRHRPHKKARSAFISA
jgi:hypothetical protein